MAASRVVKSDAKKVGHRFAAARRRGEYQSDGHRRIVELDVSTTDVGHRIRVSKQSVSEWRLGKKRPGQEMREELEAVYGIPVGSWDVRPGASAESQATAAPPPAQPAVSPQAAVAAKSVSTLDECLAMVDTIRSELAKGDLLPSERMKYSDTMAKLLTLRARLEKDAEMLEDRVATEHPAWQRIKRRIVAALVKHPAAAREVKGILEELGA